MLQAPTVNVVIRDPLGNIVGDGDPGYSQLISDERRWQQIRDAGGLDAGEWTVEVSGDGDFSLRLLADSNVHLAYQGDFTPRSGQPTPMRAYLSAPGTVSNVSFKLVSMDGSSEQPIQLFDDGAHGDGQPNDGWYGGMVTPQGVNCWFLVVEGQLQNGDDFRRQYHAPIRIRGYQLTGPDSTSSISGATQVVSFTLANNTTEGGDPVTYDLGLYSELGWTISGTVPASITLGAGQSYVAMLEVTVPATATNGLMEEITLVAAPLGDIGLSAVVVAEVTAFEGHVYLPIITRP